MFVYSVCISFADILMPNHLGAETGPSKADRGVNCCVDKINEVKRGV